MQTITQDQQTVTKALSAAKYRLRIWPSFRWLMLGNGLACSAMGVSMTCSSGIAQGVPLVVLGTIITLHAILTWRGRREDRGIVQMSMMAGPTSR
jgi:hypothetical protein